MSLFVILSFITSRFGSGQTFMTVTYLIFTFEVYVKSRVKSEVNLFIDFFFKDDYEVIH